jgi:hypothetical protein
MEKRTDIRVTNVRTEMKTKIKKIAEYNGLTTTQFIKSELQKIINETPPHVFTFSDQEQERK